jgi:hypothetical protein
MSSWIDEETMDFLLQVKKIHCEEGDPCDYGSDEQDLDALMTRSREIFPDMPVCIVKRWVWVDLPECPPFAPGLNMEEFGYKPCFLYANQIVFDEQQRFSNAKWIRSTFLMEFVAPCFFRTGNTCYILAGRGTRVSVDDVRVYHDGFWP